MDDLAVPLACRLAPALLPLAGLAACAGDFERSLERWYDYSYGGGPYARWAGCIQQRSYHYLDPEASAPDGPAVAGTPSQLFIHVLEDCRAHMAGPAWANLGDGRVRELIADAHRAFGRAEADIIDRHFHSIIGTGTDAQH